MGGKEKKLKKKGIKLHGEKVQILHSCLRLSIYCSLKNMLLWQSKQRRNQNHFLTQTRDKGFKSSSCLVTEIILLCVFKGELIVNNETFLHNNIPHKVTCRSVTDTGKINRVRRLYMETCLYFCGSVIVLKTAGNYRRIISPESS